MRRDVAIPTVPSGCRARPGGANGQIVCPGGFLAMWASVPDDEAMGRALRNFGEMLVQSSIWPEELRPEPKEMPCRIAGVEATCTAIVVSGAADASSRAGEGSP